MLENLPLRARILAIGIVMTLGLMTVVSIVVYWQNRTTIEMSRSESVKLAYADLDHIVQGVYNMCAAQQELLEQKVRGDLNVAREVFQNTGPVSFAGEKLSWKAVNQFDKRVSRLQLPRTLVGTTGLGQNREIHDVSPIVDHVKRLVGGTCTIFQRMDAQGDMLRICTNVTAGDGKRAVGTYIPAIDPDGKPDPVVSAVLAGRVFLGRAFVVDAWYVTAYEPIRDARQNIVGMLYVGVKEESVASLREQILKTRVGRTGSVYVLDGRGKYVIAPPGKQGAESLCEANDSDATANVRDICDKARSLHGPEIAEQRYHGKSAGGQAARSKIARFMQFQPWDWIICAAAYEDELLEVNDRITAIGRSGTLILGSLLVFALLTAAVAWYFMAGAIGVFAKMNRRLAAAQKSACDELAERRAAEERLAAVAEALHDRNEWLATVVSASADAIIAINDHGVITLFNPAAGRIFGWQAEEMIGQPVERLMSEELRETHRRYIGGYFKTGKPNAALGRAVELIGVRSNGNQFPLELSIAVGRPASKQFAVAVLRDITERKRHEEELCRAIASAEEATSRLRKLTSAVEQNPASVVITNLQGAIEYVNPGFVHTTGYTQEEALGNSPRALKSGIHPPEFYQQMWNTLTRGEVWRGELCNRKKNGELFWEDATIAPVADAQGAVTNFMAVKMDISSRKQAEEALRAAKEQAEEASRAKSQFLAVMSHELRTPLNGVIGMTELLQRTELDDRQRRFVEACQSSGKSLLAVINDILDFSKIEAGKLDLDEHEFDLDRVVEETVETMAFTARQKGIELLSHVAMEACCRVVGDSGRLRQLLVNLIGNAIKFTDAGQVTVRVAPAENESHADTLRFKVSDTGIGIPPDRLDRLFQSFSQADSSTTRKYGGTGLGLAISKSLVELMGGQIGVESEPGRGSTFWFTLPWKAVAGRNDSCRTHTAALQRLGVLVLDGQPASRGHLVEMFCAWRIPVDTATTPADALARLRPAADGGFPVDLLLVDEATLAGEPLADFVRKVHQTPGLRDPRIFFLASPENAVSEAQRRTLGIDRGLSKPLCQSALLGAINDCFIARKTASGSAETPPAMPPAEAAAASLAGARVLLAEDNCVNRMFAGELLRQAGVECRAVENGWQAMEAVRSERFDLILMDCQMPEMDGFDATRRIREMERGGLLSGHLPVIALTANAIKGDRERCVEAGMDDYLSKPFEPQSLFRILTHFLALKERKPADTPIAVPPDVPSDPDSLPPINRDVLVARCMGNLQFAESLLTDFAGDLPDRVDQILRSAHDRDGAAAAKAAHALKGAAGIIAAEPVRAMAAKIEALGKAGSLDEIASLADELRNAAQQCLRFIPEVRERVFSK
jgi:Amt family ammonium transporter